MSDIRLKQLHGRLGDLVYQFTKVHFSQPQAPHSWAPQLNAYKCSKGFAICVDLAGMRKEEINITVQPRKLKLDGWREMPEPKGKGEEPLQIVAMEIDAGQFTREISLPTDVEPEGVRAEYQDGLLWIYLPYQTQA